MKQTKIGILAIQGSFIEHANILKKLKASFMFVKSKNDLENLTHLIIPGGESTTITSLLKEFNMWKYLQEKIKSKQIKIFGTCAGAIICDQLGMNIKTKRNGYGSQLNSFTAPLNSKIFPDLSGVFIRAPKIISSDKTVKILATYINEPVLIQDNNFLVATFHPELNNETRIHKYFLNI